MEAITDPEERARVDAIFEANRRKRQRKYDWNEYVAAGGRVRFKQGVDFPGETDENPHPAIEFANRLRNAASQWGRKHGYRVAVTVDRPPIGDEASKIWQETGIAPSPYPSVLLRMVPKEEAEALSSSPTKDPEGTHGTVGTA